MLFLEAGLGNYKYYDMDKVIKSALEKCKEVLEKA